MLNYAIYEYNSHSDKVSLHLETCESIFKSLKVLKS